MNFEKGKWYKVKQSGYSEKLIQFSKKDGDYIYFFMGFDYNTKKLLWGYFESGTQWCLNNIVEYKLIDDISEFKHLLPKDHPDLAKQYDYEVVHCETQKEWNFVCDIFNKLTNVKDSFKTWGYNTIYINGRGWNTLDSFKKQNSKIYTFEEWCDKFGHKPEFLNMEKCKFKVGDYLVAIGEWKSFAAKAGSIAKVVTNETDDIDKFYKGKAVDIKWICQKDSSGKNQPVTQQNGFYYQKDFRKATLKEIETIVDKLTNEEIIEVCKQFYPIGTKFKSTYQGGNCEITKLSFTYHTERDGYTNFVQNEGESGGWLYRNGKFAEIVSESTTLKLGTFPNEGCCYSLIHNDVSELEQLSKYLLNRPYNRADGKIVKSEAIGIGWNQNSCWWLKTKTSGKTEYQLSDLEHFLPIKIDKYIIGIDPYEPFELTDKKEEKYEIVIPEIIKPEKKELVINLNSKLPQINIELPKREKKVLKPIIINNFKLQLN